MSDRDVRERPILFSGPMIKAILDGRKTQTRRTVNPQPPAWTFDAEYSERGWGVLKPLRHWLFADEAAFQTVTMDCPYGKPGDRLWVRETFRWGNRNGDKLDDDGREQWLYASDGHPRNNAKWKPSIFMPRTASRITLEIVSVRVERLQEISESDAISEGVERSESLWKNYLDCTPQLTARLSYSTLWESINGNGSWAANSFVWGD